MRPEASAPVQQKPGRARGRGILKARMSYCSAYVALTVWEGISNHVVLLSGCISFDCRITCVLGCGCESVLLATKY